PGSRACLRLLAGEHVPGRGGVRLARPWQLRRQLASVARHACGRRRHADRGDRVCRPQPGRRRRAGRDRPEDPAAVTATTLRPRVRTAVRRNPTMAFGIVVLTVIVLVALLAPWIAPQPGDAGEATHPFQVLSSPSSAHPFGTDLVGRDLLTRVMYGARISLRIVVEVLVIAGLVGIPLGLAAGYFGGHVDQVIMRITDVFLAFPALLLSLAIAFVLTPSVTNMTIAIAVTWWPWYTRLVRGEAASVSSRPYIESCRVLGVSPLRVLARHVLPNSITPVLVQMSMDAGGILL